MTTQKIKLIRTWAEMGVTDEDILNRLEALESNYRESEVARIENERMQSQMYVEDMEFKRRQEMEKYARETAFL